MQDQGALSQTKPAQSCNLTENGGPHKLVTQDDHIDQIKQSRNSMSESTLLKDSVYISAFTPVVPSHFLRIRPYLMRRPPQENLHMMQLVSVWPQYPQNKEVKYVQKEPTFQIQPEQVDDVEDSDDLSCEISSHDRKVQSEVALKSTPKSEPKKVEPSVSKQLSFPKVAALIMQLVFASLGSEELIKSAQPQSNSSTVKKLLGRIFCKMSLFLPDELFNKSLGSLEKEFVMYRALFGKLKAKNKLIMAVNNCEEQYAFEPGFIAKTAEGLAKQTHIWYDQDDEREEEEEEDQEQDEEEEEQDEEEEDEEETLIDESDNQSDLKITIPLNLPKEESKQPATTESSKTINKAVSLIDNLKLNGAFLHSSFRNQALEDQMSQEFIEKASDMLFKLPDVDSNVENQLIHNFQTEGRNCFEENWNKLLALKLVLWRGFDYLKRIGVEVQKNDAYTWIKTGIKSKSSSGRPVGNLMLDKVAMSSIHAMIQNGLLPHFDYLISKQIVAYLESETECSRSEGWKRKFNSRYKRYVDQKNYEYFSYPIPKEQQLEFIQMFKSYLTANEKYLSYKKKGLYAWLSSTK